MMITFFIVSALLQNVFVEAFHVGNYSPTHRDFTFLSAGKVSEGDDGPVLQKAFAEGTFVEFEEKKRVHIGKILEKEHKTSGGARYKVEDKDGKAYNIADKAVHFAIGAPNSPGQASKLFDDFCAAYEASEAEIEAKLEMTPELLEMAWEEANIEETDLTPAGLVELVHAHAASGIEKYMAWRLLQTEAAHVFFKEMKDHGRVVSFKAKARKAVDAAKSAFCNSHKDSELCLI